MPSSSPLFPYFNKLSTPLHRSVTFGRRTKEACRVLEISEQTYYRWQKEYGGLDTTQAKKLKELEKENSRLKSLVADLSLDNAILP